MVSLILVGLGLSLSSMTLTYPNALDNFVTTTCYLTTYTMQDDQVVAYHYSGWDESESLKYSNRYDIQFSGGQQFSFEIALDNGEIDSSDWYSLKFKVWKESYLSNVYLGNIKVTYYGDSPSVTSYLKNVYFLGQNEYYEDDTSGYYTLFYPHVNDAELYIDFDICLMDSRLVDGSAYQNGYNEGWNAGNDYGFEDGYDNGYQDGYNTGFSDGFDQDTTALTIFTGIINVALLPVNVFLSILNFEVFGINIGGLVSAFLTIAVVIILWRIISGNKND